MFDLDSTIQTNSSSEIAPSVARNVSTICGQSSTHHASPVPSPDKSDQAQLGHQNIRDPHPYNILNLGTSYILGNIQDRGLVSETRNLSSGHNADNITLTRQGILGSKRSHSRRHSSYHHGHESHLDLQARGKDGIKSTDHSCHERAPQACRRPDSMRPWVPVQG